MSSPGQHTKAQSLTCVVVPLQSPDVQFLTNSCLPPPHVAEHSDALVQLLYMATIKKFGSIHSHNYAYVTIVAQHCYYK